MHGRRSATVGQELTFDNLLQAPLAAVNQGVKSLQQKPDEKRRVPRDLLAAFVIIAFGVLGVAISLYGTEWFGSPGQRCLNSCALQGKEGIMTRVYPKGMTGSKDGPMECLCR